MRRRAGVTQNGLAERAGMAQSAISDCERGRKEPSMSTLERLAEAVDFELVVSINPRPAINTLPALRKRKAAILELCARHGASNPRVFGSFAQRRQVRPSSDVDLLVDLSPGRTLFDGAALHDDLVELLGRPVDVMTSGAAKGRMADVLHDAIPL